MAKKAMSKAYRKSLRIRSVNGQTSPSWDDVIALCDLVDNLIGECATCRPSHTPGEPKTVEGDEPL